MNKVAIVFMSILCVGIVQAQTFKVDKTHSSVNFKIKHMMVSNVTGNFGDFTGSWTYDAKSKKITSFEITIPVKSIDTDNEKRDEHLRNPDFFDVEKHANITFKMTEYSDGKMTGKFTMRGTTKEITLNVTVSPVVKNPMNPKVSKQGLEITGVVKRKDYNVGNEYGEKMLGLDVPVELNLEGDYKTE